MKTRELILVLIIVLTGMVLVVFFYYNSVTNESDFQINPPITILIEIKDPIDKRGLVPIITHYEYNILKELQEIEFLEFQFIGHDRAGPNDGLYRWDFLPRELQKFSYSSLDKNGTSIDYDYGLARRDSARAYFADCGTFDIEFVSAIPVKFPIPLDSEKIVIKHSQIGLLRDNDIYTIKIASPYHHGFGTAENIDIVSVFHYDCMDKSKEFSNINYDIVSFRVGGPIIIPVDPAPEPSPDPISIQCKPGLPPWTSNFYLDKELCEWKLIPEPREADVFPHIWNAYLHRNSIDFSPKVGSYVNTDEGLDAENENKVCSPLIAVNGTKFYISSIFNIEPLEIIQTITTPIQPDNCQKILKTDTILVEPTPELLGWLENYYDENEN